MAGSSTNEPHVVEKRKVHCLVDVTRAQNIHIRHAKVVHISQKRRTKIPTGIAKKKTEKKNYHERRACAQPMSTTFSALAVQHSISLVPLSPWVILAPSLYVHAGVT